MSSRQILFVAFRLLLVATWPVLWQTGIGENSVMAQAPKTAGKKLPDWVTISDKAFCHQNFDQATGDQQQRSVFAWQLFARLNQPVKSKDGPTFTAWEVWPSDNTTFPPKFKPPIRRPGPEMKQVAKTQIGGQEVTRNPIAYDYIARRQLYLASQAEAILAEPAPNGSPQIDFPVGAIETKAQWVTLDDQSALPPQARAPNWNDDFLVPNGLEKVDQLPADMYTIQGEKDITFGLVALHIMAKIKDYPDGPRNIDDPSWFWTTFEYYGNPNRKYLIEFVTYRDTLTYKQQVDLLNSAGLGDSQFAIPVDVPVFDSKTGTTTTIRGNNYLSSGTQYRFVGPDPKTNAPVNVVLGNSVLESAFVIPAPPGSKNPFRGFNASCHSCHFEAAGNGETILQGFHSVTGYVMLGEDANGNPFFPIDFEWSIPFRAAAPAP